MPSPSPPFTFYQLQMEIKEEATSSQLDFNQTNKIVKGNAAQNKGKMRKNLMKKNSCDEYFENFPLVNPVKVIDLPH